MKLNFRGVLLLCGLGLINLSYGRTHFSNMNIFIKNSTNKTFSFRNLPGLANLDSPVKTYPLQSVAPGETKKYITMNDINSGKSFMSADAIYTEDGGFVGNVGGLYSFNIPSNFFDHVGTHEHQFDFAWKEGPNSIIKASSRGEYIDGGVNAVAVTFEISQISIEAGGNTYIQQTAGADGYCKAEWNLGKIVHIDGNQNDWSSDVMGTSFTSSSNVDGIADGVKMTGMSIKAGSKQDINFKSSKSPGSVKYTLACKLHAVTIPVRDDAGNIEVPQSIISKNDTTYIGTFSGNIYKVSLLNLESPSFTKVGSLGSAIMKLQFIDSSDVTKGVLAASSDGLAIDGVGMYYDNEFHDLNLPHQKSLVAIALYNDGLIGVTQSEKVKNELIIYKYTGLNNISLKSKYNNFTYNMSNIDDSKYSYNDAKAQYLKVNNISKLPLKSTLKASSYGTISTTVVGQYTESGSGAVDLIGIDNYIFISTASKANTIFRFIQDGVLQSSVDPELKDISAVQALYGEKYIFGTRSGKVYYVDFDGGVSISNSPSSYWSNKEKIIDIYDWNGQKYFMNDNGEIYKFYAENNQVGSEIYDNLNVQLWGVSHPYGSENSIMYFMTASGILVQQIHDNKQYNYNCDSSYHGQGNDYCPYWNDVQLPPTQQNSVLGKCMEGQTTYLSGVNKTVSCGVNIGGNSPNWNIKYTEVK